MCPLPWMMSTTYMMLRCNVDMVTLPLRFQKLRKVLQKMKLTQALAKIFDGELVRHPVLQVLAHKAIQGCGHERSEPMKYSIQNI